jgi:hypothetical protein
MADPGLPSQIDALLQQGHPLEALERARAATLAKPDSPEASDQLARVLRHLRRPAEAADVLQKRVDRHPNDASAWERLGAARAAALQTPLALGAFQRALQLDPRHRAAWNNLGLLLHSQLLLREALNAFGQAQEIDPHFPGSQVNAALTRLLLGDYPRGWLEFESRWRLQGLDPRGGQPQPIWLGQEPLSGKRLLLRAEQGLGDTLHFARYAALLRDLGATVFMEVQPELRALLQSLPGPAAVFARGEPLPSFDLQCPLLSLPLALGPRWTPSPGSVPYLAPDPAKVQHWRTQLPALASPKPLVGLVWRGNPGHFNDANRSLPVETLRPLLNCQRCLFLNLQIPPDPAESSFLSTFPHLHDPTPHIRSFDDTAALLASLDLLITVDTSVAHLAGALGKPVWILLPYAPDWRWGLARTDCPAYPTARLFRQPAPAAWEPLLRNVRLELEKLPPPHRPPPA